MGLGILLFTLVVELCLLGIHFGSKYYYKRKDRKRKAFQQTLDDHLIHVNEHTRYIRDYRCFTEEPVMPQQLVDDIILSNLKLLLEASNHVTRTVLAHVVTSVFNSDPQERYLLADRLCAILTGLNEKTINETFNSPTRSIETELDTICWFRTQYNQFDTDIISEFGQTGYVGDRLIDLLRWDIHSPIESQRELAVDMIYECIQAMRKVAENVLNPKSSWLEGIV